MDIEIKENSSSNPTTLNITNKRTFQHLALLVDRSDFIEDVKKYRPIVLAKVLSTPKSKLEQYQADIQTIPDEIFIILNKYHYPSALAIAILSLFIKNIITDKETKEYEPQTGKPKSKLRSYIPHPFDFRLDRKIKDHRYWYLIYNQNKFKPQKDYLGYKQISKIVHIPYTTIATAITMKDMVTLKAD